MRRLHLLLLAMFITCLSGCMTAGGSSTFSLSPSAPVWPPSPAAPRIALLKVIAGPSDVAPPAGGIRRLWQAVTGERDFQLSMDMPYGLAFREDVLYVADSAASVVHCYDFKRQEVSYISAAGSDALVSPVGVAVDSAGNIYVTDSFARSVFKFDRAHHFIGTLSSPDGFGRPAGIAIGPNDEKYVVDVLAHNLKKFDRSDLFTGNLGSGAAAAEALNMPSNVAVDRMGRVYVTDSMNFRVQIFSPEGRMVAKFGEIGDAPGSFARPKGIAVDSDGHVYVVDATFGNFQIFSGDGKLLLHVGRPGNKAGQFSLPSGIFIDRSDRIFVSDSYNHRIQVFQYLKEGARL